MRRPVALIGVLVASCAPRAAPLPPAPAVASKPVVAIAPDAGGPEAAVDAAPDAGPRFGAFPEAGPFRLPHTFEPRTYRARIAPGDKRFTGHLELTGNLSEPTALLWLHGVDLVVTSAVASRDGETVQLEFSPRREDQLLGLRAHTPLARGVWTLTIDYSGRIRDEEQKQTSWGSQTAPAAGFFRRVVDGETYLFTQGEAINARMIFPCIDEPDRKVPWQLTLDVAKDAVVASNTPIRRETPLDATHKRVEFNETLPLPSYLLAFAIGPFDVVEAGASRGGVPVRILAQHRHGAQVAAAAKATPQLLDKIADWVQVPYAYGKLDLVAVPKLGFGAMENPGLITIDQSSVENNETDVIAHELAHQWFGDLVTLRWWDDIWLNESFATFIETEIDDPVGEPLDRRTDAMTFTASPFSVRPSPNSNADLGFNYIAQHPLIHQGASVLQLLEIYVGPERFRQALTGYLKAHAHGTVSTDDLIASLETATKMKLRGVVTALLAGFDGPLEFETQCKGTPRVRFHTFTAIPVCIAYDHDGRRDKACASIDEHHPDVALRVKSCPRWVMPNAEGRSPYRVAWTPAQVHQLVTAGWPALADGEKQVIFEETTDDMAKLEAFVAHMRDSGAHAFRWDPLYIAGLAKFVPADLRSTYVAWAETHYGARARAIDLTQPTGTIDPSVALLARVGDHDLERAAERVAPTYASLKQYTLYFRWIVSLRATADPAFLTAALDAAAKDQSLRYQTLGALGEVPGIVRALDAAPKLVDKLDLRDVRDLIGQDCDPADRATITELIDEHPKLNGVLRGFDQCLAQQKLMEPLLRRWLTR